MAVRPLFAPDAQLHTVATNGGWFEGPAWVPSRATISNEDTLVWSDVTGDRLLVWDARRGARVWLEPSFHQNGHTVDAAGRLLAASHGERAIVRRELDGSWTIVADLVDGKRFNSPNDLVVAQDGAVWFTDPRYGLDQVTEGYGGLPEVEGAHVYRVDPREPGTLSGANVRCVSGWHPEMQGPNGLAFSPDESVLYVTDSEARHVLGFAARYSLDGPELGFRWLVHETRDGASRRYPRRPDRPALGLRRCRGGDPGAAGGRPAGRAAGDPAHTAADGEPRLLARPAHPRAHLDRRGPPGPARRHRALGQPSHEHARAPGTVLVPGALATAALRAVVVRPRRRRDEVERRRRSCARRRLSRWRRRSR